MNSLYIYVYIISSEIMSFIIYDKSLRSYYYIVTGCDLVDGDIYYVVLKSSWELKGLDKNRAF